MASYKLEIKPSAQKEIRRLPLATRQAVVKAIYELAENPRPIGVKKLIGLAESYRIRLGDYRVVYRINDKQVLIMVVKVGHRSRVY